MSSIDTPRSVRHDPFSRRILVALGWCAAYGAIWYFRLWRPFPQVAWVSGAIVAAILIGTLPPEKFRNFTAAFGYVSMGFVMQFVIHNTLAAIVLALFGAISTYNGVSYLQQTRVRG